MVCGPLPGKPLAVLMDLVTFTTAFEVTVVVSVTLADTPPLKVLVAVTTRLSVLPDVAVAGTVPTATKRNTSPIASAVLAVIGMVLSATPSPFASA